VKRLVSIAIVLLASCNDRSSEPPRIPPPPSETKLAIVPGELDAFLLSAWAPEPGEAWFAGGYPRSGRGVVARLEAGTIREVRAPVSATLWWIFGGSRDLFWVSGERGRIMSRRFGAWLVEETGLDDRAVIWGLWGSSTEDLWAVGGSNDVSGPKGLILRSRGDGAWIKLEDPAIPSDANLFKVWGSAPDDVHIVGELGIALHWDGARLSRVDTPLSEEVTLFTVHGRTSGPIFAVGGSDLASVLRFDGVRWEKEGGLPIDLMGLNGVFVRKDGAAIVSGAGGEVLERSQAGAWRRVAFEGEAPRDEVLHAVAASDEVWVVGGDFVHRDHGLIATSLRPLPVVDLPPDELPDAGSRDASTPEVGLRDASVADALFRADSGRPPDSGVLGPGVECDTIRCDGELECQRFVIGLFVRVCTEQCMTPSDCEGFGEDPCCIQRSSQQLETYCIPRSYYPSGCP
jgi:hypothetical protein